MRDIIPLNNNGSIQLKFSVGGQRYSFNPIKGGRYTSKRDRSIAQATATKIQNDILAGIFDPTLNRYRHRPTSDSSKPKPAPQSVPHGPATLLAIWDRWVESLHLPAATQANHYACIRRMIVKSNPAPADTQWLMTAKLAPSTFNKRLGYLKSCFKWAIDHDLVKDNPFAAIKARKTRKPHIKPFTSQEIQAILAAFEQRYPHFVPFVSFLFMTGARLGEAIGLQWKHIDFHTGEVIIQESLSRDRTGNGYQTIRKETKTGNVRYLKMTPDLRVLFTTLPRKAPDDLVFTSSQGCPISADNFRDDWKTALKSAGVEYRKPYTTRHTFLSYAIEQGVPITGVAYIAGHTDSRMVMQTYGHMINRPDLPEITL